jgi:hypothetical protein
MNSDMLISIDDAELDNVAGGLGAALDLGRLGSASLDLSGSGLTTKISLFGKTLEINLGFFAKFCG